MPKEDPFVNRAQLLKAIKKYPEIWDSNNKLHMCRSVTSPMWNEIAEQFGGHVPTVKLQSIWSQMKYHYHNLVHRQILHKERFTTKWEHFEPMSFMYNITVSKILGAAVPNAENDSTSEQQQQHQQQQHHDRQIVETTVPPTSVTAAIQEDGRSSGSFTWLPEATLSNTSQQSATILSSHQFDLERVPQPTYTRFTGFVPPAAITVEASTTPIRKLGRPSSLHNSMRGRIIDAIKARPSLWAGRQRDQRQGQNRTSAVWKECASELGLTPTLVQTRWSIIKRRYVDELQKERRAHYAQQEFRSNWEHFERMCFMRDILIRKVDEREQTREQIQEIVNEHHQQLQQQQHNMHTSLHHYPTLSPTRIVPPTITHPSPLALGLSEHAQDMPIGLVQHPHVHSIPTHLMHFGVQHARRRAKHESHLDWDPFEMIMHVHGGVSSGDPVAS